jgi:hypothetical protein
MNNPPYKLNQLYYNQFFYRVNFCYKKQQSFRKQPKRKRLTQPRCQEPQLQYTEESLRNIFYIWTIIVVPDPLWESLLFFFFHWFYNSFLDD